MTSPLDEVIGRVIRGTRLTDTSYIADMPDWVVEALGMMHVRLTLSPMWVDVPISFHKGRLPHGIRYIDAVLYNGFKVGKAKGTYSLTMPTTNQSTGSSVFVSSTVMTKSPSGNATFVGQIIDIDLVGGWALDNCTWYDVEGNYITFTTEECVVRICYHGIPTDCNNVPLIPDNENLKTALYWYIRMKLIETGYTDPAMDWKTTYQMWDTYAPRARNEIKYPSTAEMDRKVCNMHGFITTFDWSQLLAPIPTQQWTS